jgi:uncharacterized membrane protein
MLAMAALAIDVVTLYVARTEMQRAADGAALAAARAFVDSGVTTDPTNTTRQTLATDMATALINTTIQQNKVGGGWGSAAGLGRNSYARLHSGWESANHCHPSEDRFANVFRPNLGQPRHDCHSISNG